MFDQSPIEERHAALGVFAAIGLGGLGAVYLIVTGGFASVAPRIEREANEPPATYERVVAADWYAPEPARVVPASFTFTAHEPGLDTAGGDLDAGELAGGDGAPGRAHEARTLEDVEQDIQELYEQPYDEETAFDFEDASFGADVEEDGSDYVEDDAYVEVESASDKGDFSAYESETPW